jgi:hypothetical protein
VLQGQQAEADEEEAAAALGLADMVQLWRNLLDAALLAEVSGLASGSADVEAEEQEQEQLTAWMDDGQFHRALRLSSSCAAELEAGGILVNSVVLGVAKLLL